MNAWKVFHVVPLLGSISHTILQSSYPTIKESVELILPRPVNVATSAQFSVCIGESMFCSTITVQFEPPGGKDR